MYYTDEYWTSTGGINGTLYDVLLFRAWGSVVVKALHY